MLLLAIAILGLGFGLCWFLIPDPDGGREEDDLPPLGDSIDRAIALAAALPPEDAEWSDLTRDGDLYKIARPLTVRMGDTLHINGAAGVAWVERRTN